MHKNGFGIQRQNFKTVSLYKNVTLHSDLIQCFNINLFLKFSLGMKALASRETENLSNLNLDNV